jgi:DNA-binding XRE family transcriptional regulator
VKLTIKACRAQVGVSAAELAKAINVNKDTVYAWETGRTSPRLDNVMKMIKFFNSRGFDVKVDDINFLA